MGQPFLKRKLKHSNELSDKERKINGLSNQN